MYNNSGKTLSIFLILILVLLICSTSIGFFLFHKEEGKYKEAAKLLEQTRAAEEKLKQEVVESKRKISLLQDKNKEADDKINSLLDEAELNEGVRKELKTENTNIKQDLAQLKKEKEGINTELNDAKRQYKEALELLKQEQDKNQSLNKSMADLVAQKKNIEAQIEEMKQSMKPYVERSSTSQVGSDDVGAIQEARNKIELDKIIVNPNDGVRGRVLSVDKAAEFVVVNIGMRQGVKASDVLAIYRGDEYLGDVRVSRVQEELCAADMIPPFDSRAVRKNDTVIFKP